VKQGCPLSPLLFGLYLDALERRLHSTKCDAPALANLHVWLLLFANDFVLMSKSEVGLQQQLDMLQQFCVEHGLMVNMKKTKVTVFNSTNPCHEFAFEGDVIEHV
jgi:hypothetical protein